MASAPSPPQVAPPPPPPRPEDATPKADKEGSGGAIDARREYFEERKMLIEARSRGYQRLEQMVSGGAAATLIFSITSSDKLIEQPRPYSAELISLAWLILLLSLSISLAAQYTSARAFTHELGVLNRAIDANRPNRWQQWNAFTGITSTVLFVIGISLIAIAAFTSRTY